LNIFLAGKKLERISDFMICFSLSYSLVRVSLLIFNLYQLAAGWFFGICFEKVIVFAGFKICWSILKIGRSKQNPPTLNYYFYLSTHTDDRY
jgi:hypothetical protein